MAFFDINDSNFMNHKPKFDQMREVARELMTQHEWSFIEDCLYQFNRTEAGTWLVETCFLVFLGRKDVQMVDEILLENRPFTRLECKAITEAIISATEPGQLFEVLRPYTENEDLGVVPYIREDGVFCLMPVDLEEDTSKDKSEDTEHGAPGA